jgi:dihydroorotate dehydrogenase electron transfer subunit
MTTLATGDSISIIGPLGRGYTAATNKKLALLVAGGMGAPPLQHMAAYLRQNRPDTNVLAFVGARSLQQLPYTVDHARASSEPSYTLKEFAVSGVMSLVATDDGSFGHKGFVTDLLVEWLGKPHAPADAMVIYTCGPEAMMSVVAKIAGQHHIDCQVSMERMMACGIGICQSCAVECKADSNTEYRLCCKDGPVFDSTEIAWWKH